MKTERELLEEILVTELAILSKLFDMDARSRGNQRSPADYSQEATDLIRNLRGPILEKLHSCS